MGFVSTSLLVAIALLHFVIFLVEAFFWTHRVGRKVFRLEMDFANRTRVLAINQGVYNAFLASGLAFAIIQNSREWGLFFVVCVFCAGIVGGLSSSKKILLVQSVPAAAAGISLLLGF